MSDNICPGSYVWAKFAQTFVKWPGKLDSVDNETDKCLIWVESEQNRCAISWCFTRFLGCIFLAMNSSIRMVLILIWLR